MILGKKREHQPAADAVVPSSEAETVIKRGAVEELRPVDTFRVCPSCLVVNGREDVYCTGCGAELPPQTIAADQETLWMSPDGETASNADQATLLPTVQPPIEVDRDLPRRRARMPQLRAGRWLGMVGVLTLVAVAVAVAFAVLWRVEARHSHHLASQLSTARSELAATQTKLATTVAQLKSTSALSQRRKQVLLRAQAVLASVDPLLSSVDNLQKRTSDIQSGRDIFSGASDALIGDMITLGNYLIQTDPSYIDATYEQQLIDTANAELSTVRADQASLGSYDTSYGAASANFGRRAGTFTQAVRKLQQQLQTVASK